MRASGGENPRLDPALVNRISGGSPAATVAAGPEAEPMDAGETISAPMAESSDLSVLAEAGVDTEAYFN